MTKPNPSELRTVELKRRTWEQWRNARKQEAAWKGRAEKLRGQLEEQIGNHDGGTINGVLVIVWRPTEKPHKFDQAKFKEDHPELFELYYGFAETTPRPFKEAEYDPELLDEEE